MTEDIMQNKQWKIHNGDCIPHMMRDMPEKSVDMAIFSPPFPSLYAYTSEACDIGNTATVDSEANIHLSFFFKGLARVLKPGRVAIVHVCQIPRMKRAGEVGLCDFRGLNIRIGERAGLIYEYDWAIRKNPQAQAIRTRSRELQFAGLESDRAKQRGCISDYLIKFRAPGENEIPIRDWSLVDAELDIDGDMLVEPSETGDLDSDSLNNRRKKVKVFGTQVSRNEWIDWAEGTWSDIQESDTVNYEEAKGEDDVKHICPLQLEVYRRCILLYSNPGEIVFEPFTGVASGGYVAMGGKSKKTNRRIAEPRRYYGCEIKAEYYKAACKRLGSVVVKTHDEKTLFPVTGGV